MRFSLASFPGKRKSESLNMEHETLKEQNANSNVATLNSLPKIDKIGFKIP
jgi:hypothetical protein